MTELLTGKISGNNTLEVEVDNTTMVGGDLGPGKKQLVVEYELAAMETSIQAVLMEPNLSLTQLEIEFADGNRQTIVSDESWRGMADGPLQFAGIYEGVACDARKEMPGWDAPGFDDATWAMAEPQVPIPKVGELVWQPR